MKSDVRTATAVDAYVGARLKALRKDAKLSQTDLAKQVGVTFQQVQKYERGTNRIGASRLWSFCQALNVKPGYFFEGVEAHLDESVDSESVDADIKQATKSFDLEVQLSSHEKVMPVT